MSTALVQKSAECEEDVAPVEVAGLGDDPVVGGAELGKVGLGRVGAGLQLVDLAEQASEQAGRVAANLVIAKRQLIEVVEHHRQPLCRAEDVEEGVEPGGGRVRAQQAFADHRPGVDPELLVGRQQQCLGASPQALGGCPGGGDDEDPIGIDLLFGEPGQAPGQRLRLAAYRRRRAAAAGRSRAAPRAAAPPPE